MAAQDRGRQPKSGTGSHWFTIQANAVPLPYEQTVSEARAVEEALARLNPDAANEDIRQHLEKVGIWLDLAEIERVRSSLHPSVAVSDKCEPAQPSELVRTQAEQVPPPRPSEPDAKRHPANQQGTRSQAPNPSEMVATEGERVPPPATKSDVNPRR